MKAFKYLFVLLLVYAIRAHGAVTSPDGRFVAYVIDTPGVHIDTGCGSAPATELWIRESSSKKETMLVRGRYDADLEKTIAGIDNLHFSLDGKEIYFTSVAWATSDSTQCVEITTKTQRFITDGTILAIVPLGAHKGMLLVYRALIKLDSHGESLGRDNYLWLVSPSGKHLFEIGRYGSQEEKSFLSQNLKEPIR